MFNILYTVFHTFVIPKGSLKSSGVMSSPVKQSSKLGKKFTELTTFMRSSKPFKTLNTKIDYPKKKRYWKMSVFTVLTMFKEHEKKTIIRNFIKLFKYPKHRHQTQNTRSLVCAYRAHDVAWDSSANSSCGASIIQNAEYDFAHWNQKHLILGKYLFLLLILIVQVSHHRARRESKKIPPVWQLLMLQHPSSILHQFFFNP